MILEIDEYGMISDLIYRINPMQYPITDEEPMAEALYARMMGWEDLPISPTSKESQNG